MTADRELVPGLHERLSTPTLREELKALGLEALARWRESIPAEELEPAIAAHLSRLFSRLLLSLRDRDREHWERTLRHFAEALRHAGSPLAGIAEEVPTAPFSQLLEVEHKEAAVLGIHKLERPDVPLGVSALLTGAGRTPALVRQIRKELASADRADWLVSFIKWSGIRSLRDALRRFTEVSGEAGRPRLRVATTSYLGATDIKAVEFLLGLPNTEVRVSYDTHRTRLHAKAYLFQRDSGFGSAYVGSANVSKYALDEGLEWTAKISQYELPYLWRQTEAAFETHWEDPNEFEPLEKGDIGRLRKALSVERTGGPDAVSQASQTFFDLHPYGFQQEILDGISAERGSGITRHLVIAATGTGKTMVAAFDYRRHAQSRGEGERPSLLFVAHREEILRQSLDTFRQVLRDSGFGDLLVGGTTPGQTRHLFCSVQSWQSRGLAALDPHHFDYVVLDEAHHASAASYQAILSHLRPQVLLGLTATPERSDGQDIREDFGGRYTHEIRLPDAVERRLLAPFHYFGVGDHDSIDLSGLTWQRGRYPERELEGVYGANEVRAKWVFRQLADYVANPRRIRGLGFCVSRGHARFMARKFTDWGLRSTALTADSSRDERRRVQRELVRREINVIFTVDLYNEGVDIPEVDTILLLRPTESLTVYLQQIGRGLRLHDDKPNLTVLDFIAPQHREFRFADRYRALSSEPSERIDRQVEQGFPWLPSGCLIDLDPVARSRVLENIRAALGLRRPRVVQELERLQHDLDRRPSLEEMLNRLHLDDPDDLLRHGLPCRLLEAGSGTPCPELAPYEKALQRGIRHLAATDDRAMLDLMERRLRDESTQRDLPGTEEELDRLVLTHSLLWGRDRPGTGDLGAVETFIAQQPELRRDLEEVVQYRQRYLLPASNIRFPERTGVIELHASYTREQVLLALGKGRFGQPHSHREGVMHIPERGIDVFFVTIDKSEGRFSPTTMYEDFAITDRLFHWQSQSGTGPQSPTGQRYIRHREAGSTPMLFVRQRGRLPNGLTAPFVFCGPLVYERHESARPMSIVWRLEHPMPARIFRISHWEAA